MVAATSLIGFEFWMMHHHNPDQPHADHFLNVPGKANTAVPDPHNNVVLPGERLIPHSSGKPSIGSGGKKDDIKAGTRTLFPQSKPAELAQGDADIVAFEPPPRELLPGFEAVEPHASDYTDEGYGDMRVAVLVPYSGPGLPLWFDAFTELAAASRDAVDWIIFCEEVRLEDPRRN